jgi:hypothetical protein
MFYIFPHCNMGIGAGTFIGIGFALRGLVDAEEGIKSMEDKLKSNRKVVSGMKCRCGHCGYEGHCYGVPTSKGVTAPFCYQCGMNNKLTVIE